MSIQLSTRDVELLSSIHELLLSPLDHRDAAAWSQAVIEGLVDLMGTDRITMLVPAGSGTVRQSHPVLEPFHDSIVGMAKPGPSGLAFRAQQLDAAFRARRRRGWRVWSNRMLEEAGGSPMTDLDFFHEVVVPAGVAAGGGLTVELPEGEALIATGPGRWPDEQWLEVLRLLVPSFRAGAAVAGALSAPRVSVAAALEQVSDGAAVFDDSGRERYRNPRLAGILAGPAGDQLGAEIQAVVGALLAAASSPGNVSTVRPVSEIDVGGVLYVVRAAHLPPHALLERPTILVLVERRTPRLPTVRALIDRFRLTHREAEVALLLARGLTNRDISERLTIRPSTVRTHAEHIFAKLGITTRKALALRLLAGDR